MADVAREAGVALATVSRALNEPDKLSPDTLAIVHETIQRLGYVPNLTAGSLASARSRVVGAIVPALSNTWFAQTLDSMGEALAAQGYELMLAQSRYSQAEESLLVDTFLGRRVDALALTAGTHERGLKQKLQRLGLPVVELWDLPASPIDMAVGFSNEAVGECAAAHLLSRGHRQLGFLGADEERSLKRLAGLKTGLARAGAAAPVTELLAPNSDLEAAQASAARLLREQPGVSALFCSNDVLATGVLMAARQAGRRVPQELAVLGFSDMPIAQVCQPPLSTIRVEPLHLGRQAAQLLLSRLQPDAAVPGKPKASRVDIGFELVLRESS
jgi:LacI family transcriptional regulator, gluconate utilization system Gnt-I transcriptional repressor